MQGVGVSPMSRVTVMAIMRNLILLSLLITTISTSLLGQNPNETYEESYNKFFNDQARELRVIEFSIHKLEHKLNELTQWDYLDRLYSQYAGVSKEYESSASFRLETDYKDSFLIPDFTIEIEIFVEGPTPELRRGQCIDIINHFEILGIGGGGGEGTFLDKKKRIDRILNSNYFGWFREYSHPVIIDKFSIRVQKTYLNDGIKKDICNYKYYDDNLTLKTRLNHY
jgi:hypothetical protein